MSSYKFQGGLYRSEQSMLDAIAYAWLGSGGNCGDAEREILAEMSDEELARECIEGWELDHSTGEVELADWEDLDSEMVPIADSHMEQHEYSQGKLANAFARLREKLATEDDEEAA